MFWVAHFTVLWVLATDARLVSTPFLALAWLLFALALIRFGLVAMAAMWFVVRLLMWPITPTDFAVVCIHGTPATGADRRPGDVRLCDLARG